MVLKAEGIPSSLEEYLALLLKDLAPPAAGGEDDMGVMKELRLDAAEKILQGKEGFIAAAYCGFDRPDVVLVISGETGLRLMSNGSAARAARILAALASSALGKTHGGPAGACVLLEDFGEADAFLSRLSGYRAYASESRPSAVFLFGDLVRETVSELFGEDSDFRGAALSLLKGDPPLAPPLESSVIAHDSEFLASYLFLPPFFACGKARAAVFWSACGKSPQSARPESLWLKAEFSWRNKRFGILYEMPLPKENGEEYGKMAGAVANRGFSASLAFLARIGMEAESPSFAKIPPPLPSAMGGMIAIEASVRLGRRTVIVRVHLPEDHIGLVLAAAGKTAVPGMPDRDTPDPIGRMILANEAMLRKNCPSYRKPFLECPEPPPFDEASPEMSVPLYGLLRILDPKDAGLIVRNFLLTRFSAKELPYFFYYHATTAVDGAAKVSLVSPYPIRDKDILIYLPETAREDWAAMKREGFARTTVGWPQFVANNEKAVRELLRAFEMGKLELSPQAHGILSAELGAKLDASAKKSLAVLREKDIPFGFLKSVEARFYNRLIDSFSNHELACALIESEGHRNELYKAMSLGRKKAFREEQEAVLENWKSGNINPDQAIAAKRELLSRMEARIEELRREEELEKEKRKKGIR